MSTPTSAEEHKALGNTAFAAKDYETAIVHYTNAIQLNPSSHVFFSNRSASHGGKGDWNLALEDAKECLKLDPTFVKGYYRLATAQIELQDFGGAIFTIKQGLQIDPNNDALVKLQRTAKAKKKKAASSLSTPTAVATSNQQATAAPLVDASVAQELQDLQESLIQSSREYKLVQSSMAQATRQIQAHKLTLDETSKLSNQNHSCKLYRSVGKMFLLQTNEEITTHLNTSVAQEERKQEDLQSKLEYLERRMKSQEANMKELTSSIMLKSS